MKTPRILVAGIGNIFFGDDAFGVEVVQRLARRPLPDTVRVVDFGIRGLDLTYALMDGYDFVILVDTLQRGGQPGTLYVLEPNLDELESSQAKNVALEPHGMIPTQVLHMVQAMDSPLHDIRLVGCEPASFGDPEEGKMGLSEPVMASVEEAITLIESLINEFLSEQVALVKGLERATHA